MVCPFRKIVKNKFLESGGVQYVLQTTEEFGKCYEHECPYYSPEGHFGGLTVAAYCERTEAKRNG